MLGWKLFLRAVTLLIENLGDALRVSAVPYGIVLVVMLLLVDPDAASRSAVENEVGGLAFGATGGVWALPLLLLNLVVSLWVAVAWHRYVLLGERPEGWLPPLRGSEMLGYLWRSILIGVIVVVAMFGIAVPLGALAVAIPPLALTIPLVAGFLGGLLFYRLGIVLPARAVGERLTFGAAMEATRGETGTVAALAVLTLGFTLLLQVPTVLDGGAGPVTVIYQGVVGWIGLMVGVSTLTALYGHLGEGRPVE